MHTHMHMQMIHMHMHMHLYMHMHMHMHMQSSTVKNTNSTQPNTAPKPVTQENKKQEAAQGMQNWFVLKSFETWHSQSDPMVVEDTKECLLILASTEQLKD
jgi:hypothetical protein